MTILAFSGGYVGSLYAEKSNFAVDYNYTFTKSRSFSNFNVEKVDEKVVIHNCLFEKKLIKDNSYIDHKKAKG